MNTWLEQPLLTDSAASFERIKALPIMFGADYSQANSYQKLLYAHAGQSVQARPGTVEDAIHYSRTKGPISYHLHWEEHCLKISADPEHDAQDFLGQLEEFKGLGGRLIWTRHNQRTHDARIAELHGQMIPHLSAIADVIHLHSWDAAEALGGEFFPEKSVVIAHGNYVGQHPYYAAPDARERLSLPQDAHVFLMFGRLGVYKSVPEIIAAFIDLPKTAHLVIAGVVADPEIAPLCDHPRIHLHPTFVPEEQVGLYFAACDTVVLPYRNSLTSGTGVLAAGFSKGVLGSDTAGLRDLFDHRNGLLFKKGEHKAALQAAFDQGRAHWKTKGELAKRRVSVRDWRSIGLQWQDVFLRMSQKRPPGDVAEKGLVG